MYDYIKGHIAELNPAQVTLESYGIGYNILISLTTFTKLQTVGNNEVKLFIHHVVREDDEQFYGFFDKNERTIFRLLISVSGVGPNSARMMLSSLSPDEVSTAIISQDVNKIKSVKGIGIKTAQRVILELKDKIEKGSSNDVIFDVASFGNSPVKDEATSALILLGFSKPNVEKVVSSILCKEPEVKLEDLIKKALKML